MSTLDDFAAGALDWPAVRELALAHAPSDLARRVLVELGPRPDGEGEGSARAALARLAEMSAATAEGREPPLAGHADPLPVIEDALRYQRSLEGEDLLRIGRLLRVADDTAIWLGARLEEMPWCTRLFEGRPELGHLREALERALDDRGEVLDDASPVLRRLRDDVRRLQGDIERRVRKLAGRADVRTVLAEGQAQAVHRRGGRPVLAVKAKARGRVPGIVHDRSQSGETLFVEPEEVVELGNSLAGARADEAREVNRILLDLTRVTLENAQALGDLGDKLGELELALLGARWARDTGGRGARVPGVGDTPADAGLLLRSARHPLLLEEQRLGHIEDVVPIDLRLGAEFDMLVVTGPNTGGKTLALKSAGVAALLTRLGLPVPFDEGSVVPLYGGVVADIGDEQEIQQNLSTFSSHLARIRAGLERADASVLVLLDELGGGTDPAEGAALGEAILSMLLERGAPTLASTHLGKLKEFAFRNARVENASAEFDLETLRPRYRLLVGMPGESRALAIARRLGLPEEVLERASQRLERRPEEAERLMDDLRDARVDAERLRGSAEERLREAEERLATLGRERDVLAQRKDALEAEAQRGLEERVARARPWLLKARATLDQMPKAPAGVLREVLDGLEEALGGAALSDRRREFLDGLKKGDYVWVPKWRKRCHVVRVHKGKGEVTVKVGQASMTVPFDDVTFYDNL